MKHGLYYALKLIASPLICVLLSSCYINTSLLNLQNGSTRDPSTSPSPSLPISSVILTNVLQKGSPVTTLNVSVGGSGIQSYKYKLGPAASTDCSAQAGYSPSAISISNKITDDISALPDQEMKLCVVGISSSGAQDEYSAAVSKTWYLDRVPVVVSLKEVEQSALESDGSNKTITALVSTAKPYDIEVTYKLVGASSYLIDHNLPESGTITIPAHSTSGTIMFQVLNNTSSSQNKYFQMNIKQSDFKLGYITGNYQSRFYIGDATSGAPPTVNSLALGGTCVILSNGTLKCWGTNYSGEAGNGTTTAIPTPVVIDAGVSYTYISSGDATTCGITTLGILKCWGVNSAGSVGDGTTVLKSSPVTIDSGTTYSVVQTKNNITCGITTTGALKCWGRNNYGQVGDATTADKSTPTLIDSGVSYSKIQISNRSNVCGITTTGVLKCWGYNTHGAVGDNTTTHKSTPTIVDSGTSYSDVETSGYSTCAITTTGILKCWGRNNNGQVGDGTGVIKLVPVTIDSGTQYAQISTYDGTYCGITSTQVLKCWGFNGYGQVGDGTTTNKTSPVIIDSGVSYTKIKVLYTTCGITSTGQAKCWGDNSQGQVGDGTIVNRYTPVAIDIGTTYLAVEASIQPLYVTCGITSAHLLKCWGSDASGKYGDGTASPVATPKIVNSGTLYSKLSNPAAPCALTTSNTLQCWGVNTYGRVGDGSLMLKSEPTPIDVDTLYDQVSTDSQTTCGITSTGKLKCWGYNVFGQVGDATVVNKVSPTTIDSGTSYSYISPTGSSNCAITTTGVLKCWGSNSDGQLGIGNNTTQLSPVVVDSGTAYSFVLSVNEFLTQVTCGITTTGVLKCWGSGVSGQIGDGTTAFRLLPVVIDSGVSYSKFVSSKNVSCGITTTGILKCWGNNVNGALGDGSTTQRTSPTVIDSGTNYASVETNGETTCGVTTTGVLKCWGSNAAGQVGNGTTTNVLSPTVIDSGTSYLASSVRIKNFSTCGITTTGVLKCWGYNTMGNIGDGTFTNRSSPTVVDAGVTYSAVYPGLTTCGITTTGVTKCWGQNTAGQLGDGIVVVNDLPRSLMHWLTP